MYLLFHYLYYNNYFLYIFLFIINTNNGDFMSFNYSELFDVTVRSLLSLITLFFVTKLIGKKQVSELSLFDYVIGITIGNFAAEMTINLDSQEVNGILAVIIFGLVAYIVSKLTMKSIKIRRFFIGVPTMIIQNGKILYEPMKKMKMDINDLLEQCRMSGYFDVSEIEYAILEASGDLSILPKAEYRPLNPCDMNLKVKKSGLCANIVIDGKIMYKNLENVYKDTKWLMKELKIRGYKDLKNILLVTLDSEGKITVYEKQNNVHNFDILE